MRKFKLLPAIFTLVLCVGTLAIGVFALAPTQNTITGTISINSVNTPVEIKMNILNKAGGDLIGTPKTIRGGDTFTLGDLAFDTADANEVYDVKDIFIEFHIKNLAEATTFAEKQAGTLGAFFAKNTVNLGDDQRATASDIFTYEAIQNEAQTLTYVNVYADSYTPILPQETVKIELQLRMETFEELVNSPINYKLYIEPYVAENADGLLKLPVTETTTMLNKSYFRDTMATHVAIPATYNGDDGGGGGNTDPSIYPICDTLVGINMPSSLTEFYKFYFIHFKNVRKLVAPETFKGRADFVASCSNLASITLPSGITTVPNFSTCTSLTKVNFKGTMAQWNALEATTVVREVRVFCTDGVILLQPAA